MTEDNAAKKSFRLMRTFLRYRSLINTILLLVLCIGVFYAGSSISDVSEELSQIEFEIEWIREKMD